MQRVIDVDLNGVFYGCRAALPIMRAQGAGSIVNIASASGLAADYGFAAYNAAKGPPSISRALRQWITQGTVLA